MKIHHGDTENTEVFRTIGYHIPYLYRILRELCDSVVHSYDLEH